MAKLETKGLCWKEKEKEKIECTLTDHSQTQPLHVCVSVNLGVFSSGFQVRSLLSYAPSQQPWDIFPLSLWVCVSLCSFKSCLCKHKHKKLQAASFSLHFVSPLLIQTEYKLFWLPHGFDGFLVLVKYDKHKQIAWLCKNQKRPQISVKKEPRCLLSHTKQTLN